MAGKIKKIEKFKYVGEKGSINYRDLMEGYKITTSKTEIFLTISMGQSCCEKYGYKISYCPNEGLDGRKKSKNFIGAKVKDIKIVEENKTLGFEFPETWGFSLEIITNKGNIYISIWNYHEGYYKHTYHAKYLDYEDIDEF